MAKKRSKKRKRKTPPAEPALSASQKPASQPAEKKSFPYWIVPVVLLALATAIWLVSGRGGRKLASLDLQASPNVLLISVDTLRADHLGVYGAKAKTPAIDELAEKGVVFEKTLAPVPVTLPSHTSLFTGSSTPSLTG